MRVPVAFVLAGLAAASLAVGQPAPRWPWTHTRWANPAARALLDDAVRRSSLVRGLLQDLEHTDLVVHVGVKGPDGGASQDPQAHLSFAAAVGRTRYLQIIVCVGRLGPWDPIPLLGHELQHAIEVAGAPEILDAKSFERFYQRIGWQSGSRSFETDLARSTGRRIQEELLWARAGQPRAAKE
jgi:hypothetical protein